MAGHSTGIHETRVRKRIRLSSSPVEACVPLPTQNDPVSTLRRLCYWFISFLLVVLPFSLLFGRAAGSVGFVLYVTLVAAFPCWCLYLPLIFRIEDAN